MKIIILKFLQVINNYAQTLLVVTTIIGLVLVLQQLTEFSKQNETLHTQSELLRKTLIQSYRPIGYIMQINKEIPTKKIIELPPTGRKDKFSFVYRQLLINEGSGVLVNIGHLYFITKEKENFRKKFLEGEYDSTVIKFDGRYDYSRRQTLLPKDTAEVVIGYDDIEFEDEYNVYVLLFYEDQEGNLYDTENILNIKFGPTSIVNDRVKANLQSLFTNNIYNDYTESEKMNLINIIKDYHHPMWKYITVKK